MIAKHDHGTPTVASGLTVREAYTLSGTRANVWSSPAGGAQAGGGLVRCPRDL